MMKNVAGIDFGANKIKVVVLSLDTHTNEIKTRSIIKVKSYGFVRKNSIIDYDQTISALEKALELAKSKAQSEIDDFAIVCDGQNILFKNISVEISIPSSASEITEHDTQLLQRRAKQRLISQDQNLKNYLELVSERFKTYVNGEQIMSNNPEGLSGTKLKGDFNFILAHKQFVNDISEIFHTLGYTIDESNFIPGLPALKEYMLAKEYTIPGCALVDIGSDTSKVAVFESDRLKYYQTINIGADYITQEIVKKAGVSIVDAEQFKLGVLARSDVPEKKMQQTILIAYKQLLKEIYSELKKQQWFDFLPGGIIFTGGGSLHPNLSDAGKQVFGNMPIKNLYEHTQNKEFKRVSQEAVALSYVASLHFLSDSPSYTKTQGLFSKLAKKLKSLLP